MFGGVYKKLAGTTPYYVVVFFGVSEVILKKVIQNPNIAEEFTIDEISSEIHVTQAAFATDYEIVQSLDMQSLAINSVNAMMGV